MKRYAIANWKMNPQTLAEAKKIFTGIDKAGKKTKNTEIVICPPAFFVSELKKGYRGKIKLGVQDVFFEPKGAFTGEVAAEMAKSVGAGFAIIGHSERRALGDDDSMVERKLKAALRAGLSPILCVGERTRDSSGEYFAFIENQIISTLRTVSKRDALRILIAYEPIFAIGKSAAEALSPEGAEEMGIFIRKTLAGLYDADIAKGVPILYGGSVERENVIALAKAPGIAGFLVGRASLAPLEFGAILSALQTK